MLIIIGSLIVESIHMLNLAVGLTGTLYCSSQQTRVVEWLVVARLCVPCMYNYVLPIVHCMDPDGVSWDSSCILIN